MNQIDTFKKTLKNENLQNVLADFVKYTFKMAEFF